jgi:cytochrome c oxidase subunit 1
MQANQEQIGQQEKRRGWLRKYVFSLDHKVIGIQYYFLALFAVLVGIVLSLLMRVQLAFPDRSFGFLKTLFPNAAPNGVITPEMYLSLVTMHGTIMVFFVLTTAPQGAFGNYFIPLQIGAKEMAFPLLNMLSFWLTFLALVVMIAAFFCNAATLGPINGWTAYAPLSALGESTGAGQGLGVQLWLISIAIFCVASMLGAINFIVTILRARTTGMTLMRMPLTCWAWFTTAVLSLLSFPVLFAAGLLLLADQLLGTSFFIPGGEYVSGTLITDRQGGSPILWQHLFWFFGHPEVYIAILPGMGLTSHVLSTFARKPVFGYRAMVYSTVAIGLLGFFVWGHHMFVSGMDPRTAIAFSVITLVIGVPSAVKTFNWLGTIWKSQMRFHTPMLFSLAFVSLFVSGGITGLFLGQTATDMPLHDTYFPVGHFHLIMGVAAVFGIFTATYFWFPKMFGRLMNETLGKIHFFLTFIGVNLIFIPFYVMGIVGAPRRYATHAHLQYLQSVMPLQKFVTYAAFLTAAAQVVFLYNLFWSLKSGKPADTNPWEATTLEWSSASSSAQEKITVYRGAYEFSVPGAAKDYVMQDEPEEQRQ